MEEKTELGSILQAEKQEYYDFDKEECFTLRYDESSKNLAAGYSTGFIGIYNLEKPELDPEYKKSYTISSFPITCLRWKPFNRTTLLTVNAEGFIIQLHSKSGLFRVTDFPCSIMSSVIFITNCIFSNSLYEY